MSDDAPNIDWETLLKNMQQGMLAPEPTQQPEQQQTPSLGSSGLSKFLLGRAPQARDDAPWIDSIDRMGRQYGRMANPLYGPDHEGQTRIYDPFNGLNTNPKFNYGRPTPPLKYQVLPGGIDMWSPPDPIPLPSMPRIFRR